MNKNQFFGAYSRRFSNYTAGNKNTTSASGSYTLSVISENPEMGTVGAIKLVNVGSDVNTPSQNQGDRGGASKSFPAGTRFRAVATPKTGYEFVSWKTNLGAGSQARTITTNPFEFVLSQNVVLTAQFKKKPKAQDEKTLNVRWNGTMGRVNCNAPAFVYGNESPANNGSITAPEGTPVTLTANPLAGYRFVRWNGLAIGVNMPDKTSPTITIAIRNLSLTAVFEEDNAGVGGEETPGGWEHHEGPGEYPSQETGGYTSHQGSGGLIDLVKKWWWVLLIAYIIYKETEGGSK